MSAVRFYVSTVPTSALLSLVERHESSHFSFDAACFRPSLPCAVHQPIYLAHLLSRGAGLERTDSVTTTVNSFKRLIAAGLPFGNGLGT
jgi:hypothetical protein